MGLHAHGVRRVALGAVLACVVSLVVVGIGTADVPRAVPPRAVPVLPVAAAEPGLPAAPTTTPVPTTTPASTTTAPAAVPSARTEPVPAPSTAPVREPVPAATAAADPTRASIPVRATGPAALVPGTPCTVTAKACADLAARTAWLIEDGVVRRGPVGIMIGDEIDPTPTGTFRVEWKAEAWTSREYLTQMPYSVFFAEGGIAFHEGSQDSPSAGCIKLVRSDAMAWFEYLQVGDEVQVR
ncbi:L,D-transpeptidase [Pseudonocardia sp.]|uniref:L,D-transpeptidase n=1 Tax=Pseudonocardia sp. TaxID=60912 RepID=UPI00260428C1|nr:L,D-transpeptidase [Pseudonocardia sp.]